MTLHCLIVDPPRPGLALPGLVDGDGGDASGGPLDRADAAALARAAIEDAMVAAERSGGELLVNYPTDDQLPEAYRTDASPETELRALAEDVLTSPEDVRFEVQVGSTFAARAGNATSHLLTEEEVETVAILRGNAPTIGRLELDAAAMKLRRHQAVIGPGTGGRASYLGLSEPIDFSGAYAPPEVEDLAGRAVEAAHEVAFLPHEPVIEDEAGLASLVAEVRARQRAGAIVPPSTATAIDRLGLRVVDDDGERRVVVEG